MFSTFFVFLVEEVKKEDGLKSNDLIDSDSDVDNEFDQLEKMNHKQRLALTLKNWTAIPQNDERLIEDGILTTLNALVQVVQEYE